MNAFRSIAYDHDFYCTRCGQKGIPVSRVKGRFRENGHLKKLYCLYCQDEINHVEVSPEGDYDKQMFLDEYRSGNFDMEGNRVIPLKEWCILYYGYEVVDNDDADMLIEMVKVSGESRVSA